jgi:hypothetical protein
MPGGKVPDLTAEAHERWCRRNLGSEIPDPADYRYFGLRVPRQFVFRSLATGWAGEVLGDYLFGPTGKLN